MSAKNIGEISIEVWSVVLGRLVPNRISDTAVPTQQKVHERSKKAMPHCVKYVHLDQVSLDGCLFTAPFTL